MKLIALALAFLTSLAQAQAWDAAADFTPGQSVGVWSYGWRARNVDFTPMVPLPHDGCQIIPKGFDCFGAYDSAWWWPQVVKNNSGETQTYDNGKGNESLMILGQDVLFLRAGMDPANMVMYPSLAFVAPAQGSYTFLVSAQLIDKAAVGAAVRMTGMPDKQLIGFADAKHYQQTVALEAGQSVEVWVEPIGFFFFATTAVRASVLKQ